MLAVMVFTEVTVQVMFWKVGEITDEGTNVFCVIAKVFVLIQPEVGCSPVTRKVPLELEKVKAGFGPSCTEEI